jgi:Formyl transferase
MRTVLICHEHADLDRVGLARWLASFSDLAGIVVIRERPGRLWKRLRRELQRSGLLRFFDVLAFRLYYRWRLAKQDRNWETRRLQELCEEYSPLPTGVPVLVTSSPNSAECREFLQSARPTLMIARCKSLLAERIFSIPTAGTWVMHPGLCPEYRNAHGCFWALANGEPENVAMTLLRIDRGVDTGPVYGYFHCEFDSLQATHIEVQHRVVFDNLDAIRERLETIAAGTAVPLDTAGRPSATWGQPWLTAYWTWKRKARDAASARELTAVS